MVDDLEITTEITEDLTMKRIIITGATSGIGLAITNALGAMGHELILGCRNMTKGRQLQMLLKEKSIDVTLFEVDLGHLTSVENFCHNILEQYDQVDVLINNAGVFSDTKKTTQDGFELTIGTNFISHFLLTEMLLPLITFGDSGRIVNISSEAALYGRIKTDETFYTKPAKGFLAYAKSKLAQVLYTIDLSERLAPDNVTVNAVHPGHVSTNIWKGDSLLMKLVGPINKRRYLSPEQAAKICVDVAVGEAYGQMTGQLIESKGVMKLKKRCLDVELRQEVMALAKNTVGLTEQ